MIKLESNYTAQVGDKLLFRSSGTDIAIIKIFYVTRNEITYDLINIKQSGDIDTELKIANIRKARILSMLNERNTKDRHGWWDNNDKEKMGKVYRPYIDTSELRDMLYYADIFSIDEQEWLFYSLKAK